ncbi:MAG: DUF2244 domain-containing protein [Alphaproteobacteria bacterium]|nr:MAG: DUF2244 domain-containing protein [Alphaproteobacteria bacterium]
MPYKRIDNPEGAPALTGALSPSAAGEGGAPVAVLRVWPHRSLPRLGYVWFVAGTAMLLLVPLLAVIGTAILWGLLPFLFGTLLLLMYFIERSYRDGELVEELAVWPDRLVLVHKPPRGAPLVWTANPYWVRVRVIEKGGPVENYVTMTGDAERDVEIGAFLSPDERKALAQEIRDVLARAGRATP